MSDLCSVLFERVPLEVGVGSWEGPPDLLLESPALRISQSLLKTPGCGDHLGTWNGDRSASGPCDHRSTGEREPFLENQQISRSPVALLDKRLSLERSRNPLTLDTLGVVFRDNQACLTGDASSRCPSPRSRR